MPPIILAPETHQDIFFPLRGLNLLEGFQHQTEGTSRDAENVRSFEPIAFRMRGGSRPGIVPYMADQLAGEIQELATVVFSDAAPLGISFDDVAILDTNFQIEDISGFTLADGTVNWIYVGGSGYYTHKSYTRDANPSINSVSPDVGHPDGGETIVVTGNFLGDVDNSTFTIGGAEATILSNDGSTAVLVTPAGTLGTTNVVVTNSIGTSAETGGNEYVYREITFVQEKTKTVEPAAGGGQTVAFDDDVVAGRLLVLVVATDNAAGLVEIDTVTDSIGSTWTQAGDFIQSFEQYTLAVYYAVAASSGSNFITYTPASSTKSYAVALEYKDTHATSPFTAGSDGSTGGPNAPVTFTTEEVTVDTAHSLFLGCFIHGDHEAGFTFPIAGTTRGSTDGDIPTVVELTDESANTTVEGESDKDSYYLGIAVVFKPSVNA